MSPQLPPHYYFTLRISSIRFGYTYRLFCGQRINFIGLFLAVGRFFVTASFANQRIGSAAVMRGDTTDFIGLLDNYGVDFAGPISK